MNCDVAIKDDILRIIFVLFCIAIVCRFVSNFIAEAKRL